MNRFRQLPLLLAICLATNLCHAAPVALASQTIDLPVNSGAPFFTDIDGNGRRDLLVIDRGQNNLLLYRQRDRGFSTAPDQTIPLPLNTAWAAMCDVDASPGLELVASTATGIYYARQRGDRFETEWRSLITASQVFSNTDLPTFVSLANRSGTNAAIPVIAAGQSVLYHRNDGYEWTGGPPVSLEADSTTQKMDRDTWRFGDSPAHYLRVDRMFRPKREKPKESAEDQTVKKILDNLKPTAGFWADQADFVDLNRNRRLDLIAWGTGGRLDFKTDLYIYMRGADNLLPEHPNQVMHCTGLPVPGGTQSAWNPVQDLKGDGGSELVLLEFNTMVISADGLIKTALSHGLDWTLTVRPYRNGAFARLPEASIPVTMVMPAEVVSGWTIVIEGDFNGDGRPDLLVRRTDTQWNIFPSTTNGTWFAHQPAMTFETPVSGVMDVQDLNGDGLSDIVWHDYDHHTLTIFMSPSRPAKDKKP